MFNTSREFEDDLNRLDETERTEVIERINYACSGTACGNRDACALITSPGQLKLKSGCCSSLSILPAGRRSAVILAVDDDPIFDQVIVSLIRVVDSELAESAYRECAGRLHQTELAADPRGE